jgi:hypothetical protein
VRHISSTARPSSTNLHAEANWVQVEVGYASK